MTKQLEFPSEQEQ